VETTVGKHRHRKAAAETLAVMLKDDRATLKIYRQIKTFIHFDHQTEKLN